MADPIETKIPNPEQERELEIESLATRAVDAWTISKSVRSDIDSFLGEDYFVGKSLLSNDSNDLILAADANPAGIERTMMRSFIEIDAGVPIRRQNYSSLRHFTEFLESFETADEIKAEAKNALKNNPKQYEFFRFLYQINPIMASTISVLYEKSRRNIENGRNDFNFEKWFVEAIDNARDASFLANAFFTSLDSRVNQNDSITRSFLNDWNWESLLPIVEASSLITSSALHTRVEDCAVYISHVPLNVPVFYSATHEKLLELWEPEILPDGRVSLYNKHLKEVLKFNENRPDQILVPVYSNVVDEIAYIKFLKSYWSQILDGLYSRKGISAREAEDGAKVYKLGNAADVFIRPKQKGFRQARIALEGTSNLSGFNIRVDYDTSREELSVDFGSLTVEEALAYADEVKRKDSKAETVIDYSRLIGPDGAFRRYGSGVVSIMGSQATYIDLEGRQRSLTNGNKAALVAAVAMQEGNAFGIRSEDFYLYHSREFINKVGYRKNFERIAGEIEKALWRS